MQQCCIRHTRCHRTPELSEQRRRSIIPSVISAFPSDSPRKSGRPCCTVVHFLMSVGDVKLSFMGCLQAQNRVDCEDDNKTKSPPLGLKFNIWFYSIYKHLTHFWLKLCLWQPRITRVICKNIILHLRCVFAADSPAVSKLFWRGD